MNPVLDFLLKISGILLGGWALAGLLRRRSAAARHLVWLLTLSAGLFAAVASPLLPSVPLRVLRSVPVSRVAELGPVPTDSRGTADTPRLENAWIAGTAEPEASAKLNLPTMLAGLWIGGALLLAGWYALGHLGLARLAKSATLVVDPEWDALRTRLTEAAFPAPVRLLRTSRVGSPMTWGMRPVVLLPDSASGWTSQRRLVVLAHEMAHAARGDYLARIIACAATVLYWFHPLVWLAARRLRLESERACDDQVLRSGISGVDYASHLLDVARGSQELRLGGAVAIGMARPSQLEGRLLAVLDEHRSREAPRARARLAGWAAVLLVVPPLVTLRPAPRLVATELASNVAAIRDSSFTREFRAEPGGVLRIELESGGSLSIRAWDEPIVRIQGRLGGADWRNTRVSVERTDRGVSLRNWQETSGEYHSTSHRFEIMVPRQFNLELKSAGGGLTLVGVEGTFRGVTGGGNILIERAHGEADLSTGGGDVRVVDSELAGSVETGGGEVRFDNVRGPLRGGGDDRWGFARERRDREQVEAELEKRRERTKEVKEKKEAWEKGEAIEREKELKEAEKAKALLREKRAMEDEKEVRKELEAKNYVIREKAEAVEREKRAKELNREGQKLQIRKAGGAITLEKAMDGATLTTGGGPIRVGASSGLVQASTGGGDITIAPASGSVHAGTGAGDVQVEIVDGDGETHVVDIQSGSGSATVTLPRSFSGRFDLETAYTRSYGRPTRIEVPWSLERETTEEWDSSEGTPRKYVRARGRVGDGDGLVRIRIVNGNITVRRES